MARKKPGFHNIDDTRKNVVSKVQEQEIVSAVNQALQQIQTEYPHLQFHTTKEWTARQGCEYINYYNKKNNLPIIDAETLDSINCSDGVSPDGGIVFVKDKDGFNHFILISEAKHQGRHDGYTPVSESAWKNHCKTHPDCDPDLEASQRPPQHHGNAIERAFKNSNTFQGMTSIYGYNPYVIFCDGFDFFREEDFHIFSHQPFAEKKYAGKSSPIRMRLVSGNYYCPLNEQYVLGIKRGNSTLYPATIYARMPKWTIEEMVAILHDVMIQSVNHLISLDLLGDTDEISALRSN